MLVDFSFPNKVLHFLIRTAETNARVSIEICRLPPPEISANNIYFRQDGGDTSQLDDLEVGVF